MKNKHSKNTKIISTLRWRQICLQKLVKKGLFSLGNEIPGQHFTYRNVVNLQAHILGLYRSNQDL